MTVWGDEVVGLSVGFGVNVGMMVEGRIEGKLLDDVVGLKVVGVKLGNPLGTFDRQGSSPSPFGVLLAFGILLLFGNFPLDLLLGALVLHPFFDFRDREPLTSEEERIRSVGTQRTLKGNPIKRVRIRTVVVTVFILFHFVTNACPFCSSSHPSKIKGSIMFEICDHILLLRECKGRGNIQKFKNSKLGHYV